MTNKILITILSILACAIGSFWCFNHVNVWAGIALFIGSAVAHIKYFTNQSNK